MNNLNIPNCCQLRPGFQGENMPRDHNGLTVSRLPYENAYFPQVVVDRETTSSHPSESQS